MPHWTVSNPSSSGSHPAAATAKAISALQTQLDDVFDKPGVTRDELDAMADQVQSFYADFLGHLKTAVAATKA